MRSGDKHHCPQTSYLKKLNSLRVSRSQKEFLLANNPNKFVKQRVLELSGLTDKSENSMSVYQLGE